MSGDWRSGSALRSHRRGHWFEPSIAHPDTKALIRRSGPLRTDSPYARTTMVGEDDENEVVRLMLLGDEDAFRIIYRAVQPGLLRYLTVLVGSEDAEDV